MILFYECPICGEKSNVKVEDKDTLYITGVKISENHRMLSPDCPCEISQMRLTTSLPYMST